MVPPPDDDHDCGWKAYAKAQEQALAKLEAKVAELELRVRGHKSERRKTSKLPAPVPPKSDPAAAALKRAEGVEFRTKLQTETVCVPVTPCVCPKCGSNESLRTVGDGKPSTVFEYVQPHFRRRIYLRETLSCRCGCIITAKAPDRVGDKTRYAPSFVAHLVVNKCGDSNPQYRLEKAYRNVGIPMSRSTMCDLLHRAARELAPLHKAALALVPQASDVHADETSIRQLGLDKRAFIWDFVTPELVVYRYAPTRSGEVPRKVLGDSKGRLVVDGYTGYNQVTAPGKRTRAGCLAHARRKLFEQREHPEVIVALDLIGAIYGIEHEAKAAGIVGTEAHLALRRERARPLFTLLVRWARHHRASFEPRSALGRAIRYILHNARELGCFLRFVTIPPDNNIAEAGLRRVALGRKNYLFVGSEESGHDFAVLYTLVASCEKHHINPIDYLADVLVRVHRHPAARVDDLLPHRWTRAP